MHDQGFETGNKNSKAGPSLLSEAHTPDQVTPAPPAQVKREEGTTPVSSSCHFESWLDEALDEIEQSEYYIASLAPKYCPRQGEHATWIGFDAQGRPTRYVARDPICSGCWCGGPVEDMNARERAAVEQAAATSTATVTTVIADRADAGDPLCLFGAALLAAEMFPSKEAEVVADAIKRGCTGEWGHLLVQHLSADMEAKQRHGFIRALADALDNHSPRDLARITGIPKSVVGRALR